MNAKKKKKSDYHITFFICFLCSCDQQFNGLLCWYIDTSVKKLSNLWLPVFTIGGYNQGWIKDWAIENIIISQYSFLSPGNGGNNWNNCGNSTLQKNHTDEGGKEGEKAGWSKTEVKQEWANVLHCCIEICWRVSSHQDFRRFKTGIFSTVLVRWLLIKMSKCVTLLFHSTEIRVSRCNWDTAFYFGR